MKNYFCILLAIVFIVSCKKKTVDDGGSNPPPNPIVIGPPPAFGYYVVGYIPSYRDPAAIPDNKFRMCNVINYAFATVNSSGIPVVQSSTNLTTVTNRAHANGAKVFISVNGTTTDWKNMAATDAGRTGFIQSIMQTVKTFGLDGVDIDWEFPTTSDGTDITFTALMKQLSDSCHLNKKYYLTMAVTAGKYAGGIRDAVKAELFPYVDFVNIMAYDDFNTTVPFKQHSDLALANLCLNFWLNTKGLPASKCVLGAPVYGRPSGITQTGTVLTYNSIISTYGGSAASDSAVVTVAGANGGAPYTIYYNGQPTIKNKAKLAKNMANGIMFWEHGQDAQNANSLIKAACDTLGRPY